MGWKQERDLLIAQTMAFVQSVTGKKPDAGLAEATPGIGATPAAKTAPVSAVEMLAAEIIAPPQAGPQVSPQAHIRIPRSNVSSDIRSEMQARVANFRAHQERFNREREAYCSATLTKLRAAIDNAPTPGRP
ncbi:MAG TPA: hypothetical protein VII37_05050 [Candidatus Acidoferrum sp.]